VSAGVTPRYFLSMNSLYDPDITAAGN